MTREILFVDQPGRDKLCRIRTLLGAVFKVKFNTMAQSAYKRLDKQIEKKILHMYIITKTRLYYFNPIKPHF